MARESYMKEIVGRTQSTEKRSVSSFRMMCNSGRMLLAESSCIKLELYNKPF